MWDLKIMDTDQSLYMAIADAMERDIRQGALKAGEKLPPQRTLAKKVGVNVTTITRAYSEAAKRGLVVSTVGSGTYVSADLGLPCALLDTAQESDRPLIELGLVLPLYAVEPDIGPILEKVRRQNDLNQLLRYTPPQGLHRHRRIACEWVKPYGVSAAPENVVITAGAQHALNCIFTAVFQPGDRVAVDCLTYPGVKTAAKRCGIQLEAIPMDAEGMTPQGLAAACGRGHIKGVYTVSAMQNPTNAVMSEARRAAIAQLMIQNCLLLIEDDLYRFLAPQATGPITPLVPEQSLYIAGISKAFYAGLRTGFVIAPSRYCNRIAQAVVDTLWMAPALNVEMACECMAGGAAARIIALKREEIRHRANLLATNLAGFDYRYTPDSMFAWLTLPDDWDADSFEKTANDCGVNVVASGRFTVGSVPPPNGVRLSLSGAENRAELQRGLEILRKILNHEIGSARGVL